ncbi:MAG TPA: hypothetical protein VF493_22880 [Terriglobales bacterium]
MCRLPRGLSLFTDFAATNGAVVHYATPVGDIPATNDLSKWNYNQWRRLGTSLATCDLQPLTIRCYYWQLTTNYWQFLQ